MPSNPNERVASYLHLRSKTNEPGQPFDPPITLSSVYALPDGSDPTHQYGRWSNPTWSALEEALSVLETAPAIAFPSGMAASAAVLYGLLERGDKILLPSDAYYGIRVFAERYLPSLGVSMDLCPTIEMGEQDLTDYRIVWIETPTNPRLELVDIAKVAGRAHLAGAILVVDNTTMTPIGQQPFELGAEIVVSSDTKATNGHSDVVFGHVAVKKPELADRVRDWRRSAGAIPGPFEAWLVHRSLETLEVRFSRMCSNALTVARFLAEHPSVSEVRYPGLMSHPQHELARKQMHLFGSVVSVTFSDAVNAERFIAGARFIRPTTSFGGVHTSAERRARWEQIHPGLVRLSVGTEPVDQLLEDLEGALT
jgi:cystathionine gamma-lyase